MSHTICFTLPLLPVVSVLSFLVREELETLFVASSARGQSQGQQPVLSGHASVSPSDGVSLV